MMKRGPPSSAEDVSGLMTVANVRTSTAFVWDVKTTRWRTAPLQITFSWLVRDSREPIHSNIADDDNNNNNNYYYYYSRLPSSFLGQPG